MSIETWKERFYPIPADAVSAEDALTHSIRKWRGLSPKALKRHGLTRVSTDLYDLERYPAFSIGSSNCALCVHYLPPDEDCASCPLHQALGHRCDDGDDSPWMVWVAAGNAAPMQAALVRAALAKAAEEKP